MPFRPRLTCCANRCTFLLVVPPQGLPEHWTVTCTYLIIKGVLEDMGFSDDIDKAIAQHGLWKQRFHSAIAHGADLIELAEVQADDACDFGNWLYGLPPAVQDTEQGKAVSELHLAFHTEAARIMLLALEEHVAEAVQALEPGCLYAQLSEQLTSAMIQWKATIENH